MAVTYKSLTYEEYKSVEEQLRDFKALETTHTTATGFYHRSFRLRINQNEIIEFHGPGVRAGEQLCVSCQTKTVEPTT